MKVLHTSDWHLGKKLFKVDRHSEHLFFLEWLIQTIKNNNIDLVLITGDIFDVQNPPHEAIRTFFEFLRNIVHQTNSKIVIISGNHDSGVFVESPTPLIDPKRIIIKGTMSDDPSEHIVTIKNQGEKIDLFMLPYFRNYEIAKWSKFYGLNDLNDEDVIVKTIEKWTSTKTNNKKLLMAHHLFGDFMSGESEYSLNLTGISSIPMGLLKDFSYVALGHIHKYQKISSNPLSYYTGSPIAFRFSEANTKFLNILEITDDNTELKKIIVPTLKELEVVKTTINNFEKDIKTLNDNSGNKEIYLEVQIELSEPKVGLADSIRELLKENITLLSLLPKFNQSDDLDIENIENVNDISIHEHFKNFYKQKFPDSQLDDELEKEFNQLLDCARMDDQ